eukprot:XP_001707832.1 Hypothetical protein GL50803_20328 [Giardia lamblia ATCC 50803]
MQCRMARLRRSSGVSTFSQAARPLGWALCCQSRRSLALFTRRFGRPTLRAITSKAKIPKTWQSFSNGPPITATTRTTIVLSKGVASLMKSGVSESSTLHFAPWGWTSTPWTCKPQSDVRARLRSLWSK